MQLTTDRCSSELWRRSASSCRSNSGEFVDKEATKNRRVDISWWIATTAKQLVELLPQAPRLRSISIDTARPERQTLLLNKTKVTATPVRSATRCQTVTQNDVQCAQVTAVNVSLSDIHRRTMDWTVDGGRSWSAMEPVYRAVRR